MTSNEDRVDGGAPGPQSGTVLTYASRAGRWVLLAMVLGSGLASLDASIVGVALPAIGRDLDEDLTALQGVVTGYTLTLSGLLLLGGSLGDRYGRRRVFSVGVAWFAVASLLCGLAPSGEVLIAARALQGIGAALLTPGSLAILHASFVPQDRAKAIGAWSGLGGVAAAAGPLLGGWLLEIASWRWLFLINLPLAAVVLAVSARHVPESRSPSAAGAQGRLDVAGSVAVTGALAGTTYGLIAGNGPALVLGAVLFVVFLLLERRAADPVLPLGLFRRREFSAVNAVTFVVYAALGGTFFLLPIVLQTGAGYSPLAAGAALLPVTVVMLLLSARSGALAARIGPRPQLTVGPLVVGAGLLLLTRVEAGHYLTQVLPAVLVFGFGLAITVAPLTSTALDAAPDEFSGVASATNNVVARAAGLIAVSVLPAAAGISGTLEPADLLEGFHRAVLIAGLACGVGGVLALVTLGRRPRPEVPAPRPERHCAVDAPPLRKR